MNKNLIKKVLGYVAAVAILLLLAVAYVPQVLQGKIVNQSDISGYQGMAHEMAEYNAAHPGDKTAWTNSMFGGMPTTSFDERTGGDATNLLYRAMLLIPRPASYLFISLLGAFLLMLALGADIILALGGAIAITFCSYNLQIILVGHNTKMQALAFLPYVLAALIFTYRSATRREKYLPATLLGTALFALALDFQIKANHQQISYYLAIIIACYVIGLFISLMLTPEGRKKTVRFFVASGLLLVLGIAGIGANATKLVPLYEYTPHTMRGGSELVDTSSDHGVDGLDIDYATAWSYGWEELPNMLIPNFNGGSSSGAVNPDNSETYKLLKSVNQPNLKQISRHLPLYWGPQPFTAGPMYMGAISVFLFLLGLLLCEGKEKWWLLAATLIAIFLSLGDHFLWFTKLFYKYAPFYNKFRTVSMSLTVLQFTLPMLGFLALSKILKGEVAREKVLRRGLVAFGVTAGFCLLATVAPGIAGSFTGSVDSGQPDVLVRALQADRRALLVSDALRSLLFISCTFALIIWASRSKEAKTRTIAAALIAVAVLADMWSVGRRYLRDEDFVTPKAFKSQFNQRPVDKTILADPALSYRVLDLTTNVFNDSHPSYWHKSIGGYSPAKLQRYQDLIDRYLSAEINGLYKGNTDIPFLSLLNTKYLIASADGAPVLNPQAYGNAWFVDVAVPTDSPRAEIDALGTVDLRRTAVLGPDFSEWAEADSPDGGRIELTAYAPNRLEYRYSCAADRMAVFSEIYYPDGWTALVDGSIPVEVLRADWTLRAAVLPAGDHTLVMSFHPKSYDRGARISAVASWLVLISLLAAAALMIIAKKKEDGSPS